MSQFQISHTETNPARGLPFGSSTMNWTRRESGPFDTREEAQRVMAEIKNTARKNGCHEYADALHIEHQELAV